MGLGGTSQALLQTLILEGAEVTVGASLTARQWNDCRDLGRLAGIQEHEQPLPLGFMGSGGGGGTKDSPVLSVTRATGGDISP